MCNYRGASGENICHSDNGRRAALSIAALRWAYSLRGFSGFPNAHWQCLATSFSMAKINNVKTAKSTYRRLIEFEEMAANIYLDLASRFSQEDPQLSSFWLDMA